MLLSADFLFIIFIVFVIIFFLIRIRFFEESSPIQQKLIKPPLKPGELLRSIGTYYTLPFSNINTNKLSGKVRDFTISLTYYEKQKRFAGTIEAPTSIPPHYQCTIKYGGGSRKTILPESGTYTGDHDFDLYISVRGMNDADTLALCDDNTRNTLLHIKKYTSRFVFTPLRTDFSIPAFSHTTTMRNITFIIDNLLRLTQRMEKNDDVKERLLHNTRRKYAPSFRLRSLQVLTKMFPDDPVFLPVLKKAIFDPEKNIAFFALSQLGKEGIACIYTHLNTYHQPNSYLPIDGVSTAIQLLAGKEGQRCLDALIDHYKHPHFKTERIQIIKAVLKIGGGKAQQFLISMLSNSHNNTLLGTIITALAERGTSAAVEQLTHIAKNTMESIEIREAAQGAIEKIQARIGPRKKGMLSLSETEVTEGTLSISDTDGEGGTLSITEEEGKLTPVDEKEQG
jgi:hypothetical protein